MAKNLNQFDATDERKEKLF